MDGINILTYNAKAILIEVIIIVISVFVAIILNSFLQSKGLENVAGLCSFIPTTTFGLYILFGKYVYLKGRVVTETRRIVFGIFFLSVAPVIWLMFMIK